MQDSALAETRARQIKERQLLADLALFCATPIWGITFILVAEVLRILPPLPLLGIRFGLASATLLLMTAPRLTRLSRAGWLAGLLCGLSLLAGYMFQTWGQTMTTPAKSAFITGLYIVLVPLLALPLLHQRPSRAAMIGIALATAGLAAISLSDTLTFNGGDLLSFCCALAFALQIVLISRYAAHVDALAFSTLQICIAAFGILLTWFLDLQPAPLAVLSLLVANPGTFWALLTLGIVATALTTLVQVIAQRYTPATHAALIYTMEPVFAGLFSYLLLGEILTPRVLLGGALILAGMLSAELPRLWRTPAGRRSTTRD